MRNYFIIALCIGLLLSISSCKENTTNPLTGLPVIETMPVSGVSSGLPNLWLKVISAGDSPLTALAFCWGESPHPDFSGDHQDFTPSNSTNSYLKGHTIAGLNPGTTYYYRAYARNEQGEIWGEDMSFTMPPLLWDITEVDSNLVINRVYFHDENNGWICGSNGTIKKSNDGGDTWTSVSSGTNAYLMDMQWLNESNAWIVGNQNTVLKTVDGGNSWQSINAGTTASAQFCGLHFEDINTGYLVSVYGAVFKTTDAGISWQQIRNEGGCSYNSIWSRGLKIFVLGQGLLVSDNGGATWRSELNGDHDYEDYYFREPATMWIVGNSGSTGILYKTDDLGQNWTGVNTSAHSRINTICLAPGTQSMWLAGENGSICNSTNDGLSWTLNYNLFYSTWFKSVCAVNENKVWIVGEGKLLRLKI